MNFKKTSKLLAPVLILALIITSSFSSVVFGDTNVNEYKGTKTDLKQIDQLTNDPESKDFAGYTVKIDTGISNRMADDIEDADNAEQLTDDFVQVENPEDVLEFADPEQISYIEPNYYIYPDDVMGNPNDVITNYPNDPQLGTEGIDPITSDVSFKYNQWNIETVKAKKAWEEGLRGNGVKIGFIDTGFHNTYSDMEKSRVVQGRNFYGGGTSTNVKGSSLHGTRVASVLYSTINNNQGIAGLTDKVTMVPLMVGNGTNLSTGADVVRAIEYARSIGVQVINMSMGMDQPYQPMEEQINYFALEGGIFVTSGGNQKRVEPRYPAGCYNSVAVGGITKTGASWQDSEKGSNHNETIDVVAPAKSVVHLLGTGTGTSYASPHVAALAVMAKQYSKGKINVTEFRELLHDSAAKHPNMNGKERDDYYGHGIVDYEEFLNQITPENSNGTKPVIPYPVYYTPNGGTLNGSGINFYYGTTNFKLPNPKRTGYTFKGWYNNPSLAGSPVTHIYAGETGAKYFYAKWEANTYTIKFNVNKGKKIKTKSKKVRYNSAVGKMPVPKRSGYKFAGWHTKKKGGTQYSRYRVYTNTKSITLYAQWTKDNTFTFYPNGGKVNKYKKVVKRGKKIGTMPVPTRNGYNFLGWYTKKKGGKQYTSSMLYDTRKNKKIYAHWTKKQIVKFNANGGRIKKYSKAISKGKKLGTLPKPTRKGYKFKGWYTNKKKGTIRNKSSIVKIAGNFTLYARWQKR